MPNPSIELAADAPAATIQVRYVDASGELQGPFPIKFDPEAALIRDQRKILDMTATSWLSFREFNGLLVYYVRPPDVLPLRDPRAATPRCRTRF